MNFSAALGILIAIGILLSSVMESEGSKTILLNKHAFMVVIGGTLAATIISFPMSRVFRLTIIALKKLFGMTSRDYEKLINEVIAVATTLQRDPTASKSISSTVSDPFLKEGLLLIGDGASEDQLFDIMETRIETIKRRYNSETNMFKNIGKFPPAFGLLGTTLGMIKLLTQLGQADSQKLVGPSMAIGPRSYSIRNFVNEFLFLFLSRKIWLSSRRKTMRHER